MLLYVESNDECHTHTFTLKLKIVFNSAVQ
jgi:hypothetical protein